MQEHLQKLMSDHAKLLAEMNHLVPQLDNLRKVFVEMGEAAVALGHQINLLSALVETPSDEMAVHAPLEIPPYLETSPAHVAEFAPDHESSADEDGPRSYGTMHHVPTPPNLPEGAVMVTSSDLDNPLPHLGGRKKTEMTAQEWALSTHFLTYMKKPPFNDWSAKAQTAKRDAFILATPQDLRMNRWGARFSKFCGVA